MKWIFLLLLFIPTLAFGQSYNATSYTAGSFNSAGCAGSGGVCYNDLAGLPPVLDGTITYCKDCKATPGCTPGGVGAIAMRQGGAWSCASVVGPFTSTTTNLYAGPGQIQITGNSGNGSDNISKVNVNGVANIQTFGAKCDGTTDNTTAIRAAVASLVGNPGTVYVPACSSTYNFASQITFPRNVILECAAPDGPIAVAQSTPLKFTSTGSGSIGGGGGVAALVWADNGSVNGYTHGGMNNCGITGPGITTNTTAIFTGGDSNTTNFAPSAYNGDFLSFNNDKIVNFGIGYRPGNNSWELQFNHVIWTQDGLDIWDGPSASVIGSISGTTLTVTTDIYYSVYVGALLTGPGIAPNTHVTAFGTGTGGNGTYTVDVSQTVASTTISVGSAPSNANENMQCNHCALQNSTTPFLFNDGTSEWNFVNSSFDYNTNAAALYLITALRLIGSHWEGPIGPFVDAYGASYLNVTVHDGMVAMQGEGIVGSISGTTLTVTSFPTSTVPIQVGSTLTSISGPPITAGTVVTAFGTGTGGVGTYTVNNSQTVASSTILVGFTNSGWFKVGGANSVFQAYNVGFLVNTGSTLTQAVNFNGTGSNTILTLSNLFRLNGAISSWVNMAAVTPVVTWGLNIWEPLGGQSRTGIQLDMAGVSLEHLGNSSYGPTPTVSSGSLLAGSKDTFGEITGATSPVTLTFGYSFGGSSAACTLNDDGVGYLWYVSGKSNVSVIFNCVVPSTGAVCPAGQSVNYHCGSIGVGS